MKLPIRAALAALLAAPLLACAGGDPPSRNARMILDGVIDSMPDIPLLVRAEVQARSHEGEIERRLNVEMLLDWQDIPAQARYTMRDAFGATLCHLGITWPDTGSAEYRYLTGNPLQAAPLPDLAAPIEDTDLTWTDLSFAFLRWPDAAWKGEADVKGRRCAVIDITAPADANAGISGVRVWVDPRIGMLLRAESYNDTSEKVRRLDVNIFRKINDRWFIKDIEVRSFPSLHRTVLRVTDVQDRERKQYLTRDTGGAADPPDASGDGDEGIPPAVPVPDAAPITAEPAD